MPTLSDPHAMIPASRIPTSEERAIYVLRQTYARYLSLSGPTVSDAAWQTHRQLFPLVWVVTGGLLLQPKIWSP